MSSKSSYVRSAKKTAFGRFFAFGVKVFARHQGINPTILKLNKLCAIAWLDTLELTAINALL